jgi:HlyD family secretion protein
MRRILIILSLIAGVAATVWWFNRPQPIAVSLAEVSLGAVQSSVANTRAGTVEACQRTKLSPISGGRIVFIGAKKGEHVKKGLVLMRLWNDDQQAQSQLAQTQVESSRKRIAEVCAIAENAERDAARMSKLRALEFVSESDEDKSRYEAQSRRAACDGARADVVQAQARVKVSTVEQNRTVLIAPFDGVVANIVGELGEYTTPSPPGIIMPPAIDLIDDTCLYIKAPMDEIDAPKIRKGQLARVSLDALPGKPLIGHVQRVAPYVLAVEKQSRTVDVEVALDSDVDNKKLLVGYSADVEVVLDSREHVLRVPTSTLIEGNKVLLFNPESKKLEQREIKTGITNWEYTEVLAGLKAGDRIVASLEREGVKAGVLVKPETNSSKTK